MNLLRSYRNSVIWCTAVIGGSLVGPGGYIAIAHFTG